MTGLQTRLVQFFYAGLAFALAAGIVLGLVTLWARLNRAPQSNLVNAFEQAHAHAFLFGWVGLTLLGLGPIILQSQPGQPFASRRRVSIAFGLLVIGIALQITLQPLLTMVGAGIFWRGGLVVAGALQLAGLVSAIPLLTDKRAPNPSDALNHSTIPLVQLAILSLVFAFVFNFLGLVNMASRSRGVMPVRYVSLVYDLLVFGTAIPLGLAFSAHTFARMRSSSDAAPRAWSGVVVLYTVALALCISPELLAVADDTLILTGRVLRANYIYVLLFDLFATVGTLLLGGVIVMGLVRLYRSRQCEPLTDRARFGRYDLVLSSAFAWLVLALGLELVRVLPVINECIVLPQEAARQAMLIGFVTLVLIGLTVRFFPELTAARRIYSPRAVLWLLILGNLAAFLGVMPHLLATASWAEWAGALSVVSGLATLLLLGSQLVLGGRPADPN